MQLADHLHGFRGGAGLAANGERVIGMNQFLESLPKQRVIINDHDPFCFRRIAFRVLICGPRDTHRLRGLGLLQHNRGENQESLDPLLRIRGSLPL